MNISDQILHEQCPSGAFRSFVYQKNKKHTDENACVTALILREILKRPGLASEITIQKALDFLESCASTVQKGGFNFYSSKNSGNPFSLVDDADDTALVTLLLSQTGRIRRHDIVRETCVLLDKYRVPENNAITPSWLRKDAFYTWLSRGTGINVVDCCVNTNVIALYAFAGLTHLRGYEVACEMIIAAIDWAGDCQKKLASLSPFYTSASELCFTLENAVSMGATELNGSLEKLKIQLQNQNKIEQPETAIFCSAYGHVKWYCPLLGNLREAKNHSISLASASFFWASNASSLATSDARISV